MEWWLRFLYHLVLGAEALALLPFATALSRRRSLPRAFQPILYYTIGMIAIWQLAWYGRVHLHNNIFCFHLTTVLQVSFLSLAYHRLIPQQVFQLCIKILYGLFLLIASADAFYWHGFMASTNLYARSFGNLLVIGFALYHILLMTNQIQLPIEKRPEFLLAAAVLFYYSMPLVVNFIQNYFDKRDNFQSLEYITMIPFVLSSWISMTLLSFMFMRFPLDYSPREALPEWLRWRRKRPARLVAAPGVGYPEK